MQGLVVTVVDNAVHRRILGHCCTTSTSTCTDGTKPNFYMQRVFYLYLIFTSIYPIVPSSPINFSLFAVPGYPTTLSANWSAPIHKNGIIVAYSAHCNTSINQAYPEQVIGLNVPTVRSVLNLTTIKIDCTNI